jgi:hypothetical protein
MEFVRKYEPNVLKNEVPVFKDDMTKLFEKHPVFVFGYGSLLYPDGWKNRGLNEDPKNEDMIECTLKGFERGPWGLYARSNFYGIIRNSEKEVNGVLLRIKTLREWVHLMSTEMIAGLYRYANYRVVDVTDCIDTTPNSSRVHAVCNRPVNREEFFNTIPHFDYYNRDWKGVKMYRSPEFAKRFLETGGVIGDDAIESIIRKHVMGAFKTNERPKKRRRVSSVRQRSSSKNYRSR